MANDVSRSSSTGLKPNVAAAIAYLFGWISGLIFILLERENRYVRFHAMQSIIYSMAATVLFACLSIIQRIFELLPLIGRILGILVALLTGLVALAFLCVLIVLIVKAYAGEYYKLPVIGDIAESNTEG